ncbi:MAG: hypothetical protein FWG44_08720 [Oscillospiraceae bacterium]|nr:hypothetical protein [Oscillospiraceae bacterium]
MKIGLTEIIILHDNNAPIPDFGKQARKSSSDFISILKKTGFDIRVTFANFGNGYKVTANDVPVAAVSFNAKNYIANGTRDIFDSAGNMINEKGKVFSETDPNEHPENIIFVLTAFGRDNASKSFTFAQIADMIGHQSYVYKWKFFCLATEPAVPQQLGIPEDCVIWMDTTHLNLPPAAEASASGEAENFLSQALKELAEKIKKIISGE